MTAYVATSGSPVSSTTLNSGDTLVVSSGGVATSNTLNAGATETVSSGGVESATIISSGATALILGTAVGGSGGGSASGDSIYGTVTVSGNGTPTTMTNAVVTNETVYSGGVLNLLATSAVASNTTVSGGTVYMSKSGILNGTTTVTNGGTVTLNSAKAQLAGNFVFGAVPTNGSNSLVISAVTPNLSAVISGLAAGDVLDVRNLSGTVTSSIVASAGNTVATISGTSGGAAVTESFILSGTNYSNLAAQSDGVMSGGGYEFYETCYATGTLIRTTRGDVAVESLAVGDIAVTRDGRRRPIRWLGHRTIRCDRHPNPRKVWPVRVAAGTFGSGLPAADLWLSPGHSLCLDDALVPVRGLVDGDRVVQVEQEEVTYWHVEVDGHDVLLANGLPAESYLDTGNRRGFENAAEITDLHFDEDPAPGYDGLGYCLELIESGPRLAAIRARYGLDGAAVGTVSTPGADVNLVVDGRTVAPFLAGGGELRFHVPAGAADVRLVSSSFVGEGGDIRRLGVIVGTLAVSDGGGWQTIALDDHGLFAGFHDLERNAAGAWRWTNGEAHVSPRLWRGLHGDVILKITGQFTGFAVVKAAA